MALRQIMTIKSNYIITSVIPSSHFSGYNVFRAYIYTLRGIHYSYSSSAVAFVITTLKTLSHGQKHRHTVAETNCKLCFPNQ